MRTKQEFYKWFNGENFPANKVRTWSSIKELEAEPNKPPTVTFRYKVPGSKFTIYQVPINQVYTKLAVLHTLGADPFLFTFNENPIDERLNIQGEVTRLSSGLYMLYTTEKMPMRPALAKQSLHAERSKAKVILEHYLDQDSLEDLEYLFQFGDVVEFSNYDYCLGNKAQNTIFWECRCY